MGAILLPVLAVACVAAIAFLGYELGRYRAGYSLLDVRRMADEHELYVAEQNETIEDLRRQIAILETAREIDRETYAQVEANLAQLQARIQAQEEELAFYQGIVSPEDGTAGLRVQSVEIEPADSDRQFLIRLVLVQAIVQSGRVAGSVQLRVSGLLDDREAVLELPSLVADESMASIGYEFRYFQTIERELELPAGFVARTVEVEIVPTEPRGAPLVQNYSWIALSG